MAAGLVAGHIGRFVKHHHVTVLVGDFYGYIAADIVIQVGIRVLKANGNHIPLGQLVNGAGVGSVALDAFGVML